MGDRQRVVREVVPHYNAPSTYQPIRTCMKKKNWMLNKIVITHLPTSRLTSCLLRTVKSSRGWTSTMTSSSCWRVTRLGRGQARGLVVLVVTPAYPQWSTLVAVATMGAFSRIRTKGKHNSDRHSLVVDSNQINPIRMLWLRKSLTKMMVRS